MIVYDTESMGKKEDTVFIAVFYNIKTKKYSTFEISKFCNQRKEMLDYLKSNKGEYFVGYNIEEYDNELMYYISITPDCTAESIKEKSDEIINSEWGVYNKYDLEKNKKFFIKRYIDLIKIWNYGIYGKSVSLKQLEFTFRFNSIEDLPYKHNTAIKTKSAIKKIKEYCKYDVQVTTKFLSNSKEFIKFRIEASKIFNLNLITDSEVSLAKKVFVKLISSELNIPEKEVRKLRTYRKELELNKLIKPVKFEIEEYKKMYDYYTSIVLKADLKSKHTGKYIISTKKSISYNIIFDENSINKSFLSCDYGLGGVHGCTSPGIYQVDEEFDYIDVDFGSYYPHLSYFFKQFQKHLPEGLVAKQLMKWFKERKTKYPKKTNFPMNYALKIIMNLAWGQSGSEFSPLFDQAVQIGVCVNGMVQLNKLSELAILNKAQILYKNTDGLLLRIEKKHSDNIRKVLSNYANHINIPLEFVNVKKLIVRDVNNFMLVDEFNNVKQKGVFETYDTIMKHKQFHKNTSAMIVPLALNKYFLEGIPVEETINTHNDIFDFRYMVKGTSKFELLESFNFNNIEENEEKINENNYKIFKEVKIDFSDDVLDENRYYCKIVEQKPSKINEGVLINKLYNNRVIAYYVTRPGFGATLSKFWLKGSSKEFSFNSVVADSPCQILMKLPRGRKEIHKLDKKSNGIAAIIHKGKNGNIIEPFIGLNREYYINKCYDVINVIEKDKENNKKEKLEEQWEEL